MSIFLSLHTQYENLGDEVINTMMLREFCRRSDVVALGDRAPDWYIGNLKEALGPLKSRMTVVSSPAAFGRKMLATGLSGPRSLMFSSCGDVSSQRSNYKRDGYFEALQYLPKLRLGLVGASYSKVSPSKARLLRISQRRSGALSVRDRRSQALLARAGVNLPVVPDLAFLLPTVAPASKAGLRDLALIMLREVVNVPFEQTVSLTADLATRLRVQGLQPAIAWQVGRDADFGRRLAEATGIEILTPPEQTAGRFAASCGLYDRTAVIFSNRLHGLLLAASRGVLPVAQLDAQEQKVRGIFEDAGLADLILPADQGALAPGVVEATMQAEWQRCGRVFDQASGEVQAFFDRVVGPVR